MHEKARSRKSVYTTLVRFISIHNLEGKHHCEITGHDLLMQMHEGRAPWAGKRTGVKDSFTLTLLGPTIFCTVTGRLLPSRVGTWKLAPHNASISSKRWVQIKSFPSLLNRAWGFSSTMKTISAGVTPGR